MPLQTLLLLKGKRTPLFLEGKEGASFVNGISAGIIPSAAEHRYECATRLCAAAAALRLSAHNPLPPSEQEDVDRLVLTARTELDETTFAQEWQIGSRLSQDKAIALTLSGMAS